MNTSVVTHSLSHSLTLSLTHSLIGNPRMIKHVAKNRNHYEHTRDTDEREEQTGVEEPDGIEMTSVDIVV